MSNTMLSPFDALPDQNVKPHAVVLVRNVSRHTPHTWCTVQGQPSPTLLSWCVLGLHFAGQ